MITTRNKILLIKKDWANIFSVKSGKIIEWQNECYQISKPIALFFDIYYGGILIIPIFLIWIGVDKYIIHDIFISLGLSLLLYFILEFFIYILIPIKKRKCWDTYSIGKNNKRG